MWFIGNFMISNKMIWIHSCGILLPAWDCLVHNTIECSGIPEKKVRQVLRVLKETCCRCNEFSEEEKEGGTVWISIDFATHTSDSRRADENFSRHSPLRSTIHQV
jgi:hypothetical protein